MVRQGVPKVKKGEKIEPGQILVSGRVPVIGDDEKRYLFLCTVPGGDSGRNRENICKRNAIDTESTFILQERNGTVCA